MRYAIEVEYNGKNYSGWQFQKNAISVQAEIENRLSQILSTPTKIFGSGRTDKGVHALAQVAHFDAVTLIPAEKIVVAMNSCLNRDVQIKKCYAVADDFHAQYDARKKTYIYQMYISSISSPLKDMMFAQVYPKVDVEIMKKACQLFVGEHDFKGFASVDTTTKSTIRTIYKAEIVQKNDEIILEIEGNGFLYNMVRIIAGTLVYVGKGKLSINDILTNFKEPNRKLAGKTLPPHALILKQVNYE